MTGHTLLSKTLLAVGLLCLVAPVVFPVQPVLVHDTLPSTSHSAEALERQGYTVIAYENLSKRGQELYVQTLENGGRYVVPSGEGAAEFPYPTNAELGNVTDFEERRRLMGIVVERPEDADLPPADERRGYYGVARDHEVESTGSGGGIEAAGTEVAVTEPERPPGSDDVVGQEQSERYDLMETRTDRPPIGHESNFNRLLSVVLGVVLTAVGGYVHAKP